MTTYVCKIEDQFIEVKKTGREAVNQGDKESVLFEVKISAASYGATPSYWIPESDLFEIKDS